MSLHEHDLKARLTRFLDRKQMPRRLEGKDAAMADEVAALAGALARNSPRTPAALAAWWPIFEARLGEICGSMWPTEKEIRDAASQATKAAPKVAVSDTGPDMRDIAVTARRMQAGGPVGESFLWGRMAVEMIAEGLIDRDTMQRSRSGAFLARKAAYGEAAALMWEAEAKDRHAAAKDAWRRRHDPSSPRDTAVPDKSAPYGPEAFAA